MDTSTPPPPPDRRTALARLRDLFAFVGLIAGYGTAAGLGVRYLFPTRRSRVRWQFVARVDELEPGGSLRYKTPDGRPVEIVRSGDTGEVGDFLALSSTCPHLGCQVHWQAREERFFCPCHNGAFDRGGAPVSGPPAEANQVLPRYELEVRGGLLFIALEGEGTA